MFFIVLSKIFEIKSIIILFGVQSNAPSPLLLLIRNKKTFTKLRLGMYSRSNKESSCLTSFLYSLIQQIDTIIIHQV